MGKIAKASNVLDKHLTKDEMKKRLEAENRLKGSSDNIEAPEFLEDDTVALNKFYCLVEELKKVEVINNVDVDLLAIYCNKYSQFVRATKMLATQDMVEYQGNNGNKVINPYLKVQQTCVQELLKIGDLFGLSPVGRSKLAHINPNDKNDKPDALLDALARLKT